MLGITVTAHAVWHLALYVLDVGWIPAIEDAFWYAACVAYTVFGMLFACLGSSVARGGWRAALGFMALSVVAFVAAVTLLHSS